MKFTYELDGKLCVVHAAPKDHIERMLGPLTDAEYKQHILDRSIPEGAANVSEVKESDIPSDREYREAWARKGKKPIHHDMVKARGVHVDKIRQVRAERFPDLDKQWMLAAARHDTKKADEVEAERQRLRDLPQTVLTAVNKCATINELKALAPDEVVRDKDFPL